MCIASIFLLIYFQQDATLHILFISGKLFYMFRVVSPPIIRSTHNCIYSVWYSSNRDCYLPLLWKSWNRFECDVHIQTSSNSSTIAAGSSNSLTSTRYCKYSCVLLMMGGDTIRNMFSSFPEINIMCNVASCWKFIKSYLVEHFTCEFLPISLHVTHFDFVFLVLGTYMQLLYSLQIINI